MASQTNEQALEATIERALTGSSREDRLAQQTLEAPQALYKKGRSYFSGEAGDFNAKYALDEVQFWSFIEQTQPDELAKLTRYPDYKLKILERLDRLVKKYGLLRLLRRGLDVEDAHFILFYQLPNAVSGKTIHDNFAENRYSVTRQVRYNVQNTREEIDMVVFINGLPIATIELKNAWTGQTARAQGIKQYKFDRDINQPLLQFGRCLVHFAVDTDEVYMTTKLAGADTFFLPFNRGHNNGKGNPPNQNGHRTAYLWEEVFKRESLANIIQHFVRLDGDSNDQLKIRTLFFPRYHQLDVVRKIVAHTAENGVGHTYLIQHSAGSGKSNSITWAAYRLIEVYPHNHHVQGARGTDQPLFDSVIVVTDRRLLDKQLRENIREFSEVKNIIAPAFTSRDLKESLEQGKRIIITTIQKFPFIVEGIADLSEKRFAVIIDEAHSSQGGTASDSLNQAMGNASAEGEMDETLDIQDRIVNIMQTRKMKGNASYFAFTATPKNVTLEKFGTQQEDGSFRPFHLYSMKQAIEEGFILDVLSNYTTYRSYYEIEKSIEDNPLFDTVRAQKKLRAFVERDPRTIATKVEIMYDHFMRSVVMPKKLNGKAKGMVVTQSIESAIRYFFAFRRILTEHGEPFKVLVAFSGKKLVDGIEYTEAGLNGFGESETRDHFDTDDYRLLIVANKYLTGFDQPKLCTMYVDKKLQGVLAVQTLSRLNRSAPKYGKKTEDLFVLDFFNDVEDIKQAFDPFYTSTTLSKATDVNVLHELKDYLDDIGVYEWTEVEQFNALYFSGVESSQLSPVIDIAAERFNTALDLSDEVKADFKIKSKQFVKVYGQMAALLPYEIVAWEKLFWFLKFLIPKLHVKTLIDLMVDELLESVDLSTYGLSRTKVGHSIGLDDSESELDPQNANPRGAHGIDEQTDPLDEIIRTFNERYFQGWDATPDEQRVKLVTLNRHIMEHPDFTEKVANNADVENSKLAFRKIMDEVLSRQRRQDMQLYRLTSQDEAFYASFFEMMWRMSRGREN